MTVYARPGAEGSVMTYPARYDNFIGGEWVAPAAGRYFENRTPVTGEVFIEIARSDESDIEKALDAAHAAAPAWGKTAPAARARVLNLNADRMEQNLEAIAVAESWDNGKPVRETLTPTSRWPSTTSATSRACCGPRKARSRRSTRTPWPITSRSRWASSARSSPGTFRS